MCIRLLLNIGHILTSSAQDKDESVPALSYKLDHEKLDHLPECELLVRLKYFDQINHVKQILSKENLQK